MLNVSFRQDIRDEYHIPYTILKPTLQETFVQHHLSVTGETRRVMKNRLPHDEDMVNNEKVNVCAFMCP